MGLTCFRRASGSHWLEAQERLMVDEVKKADEAKKAEDSKRASEARGLFRFLG